MKKFLSAPVRNAKPIIDEILKATYELNWAYPRIAYLRTNSCTVTFKEQNLRKLPNLNDLKEKHGLEFKFPSTVIIPNASTPIQLQRNIMYKLLNISAHQFNSMCANLPRTKIEYNFLEHGEIDTTPIENVFNVSRTADTIIIEADTNIYSTQELFVG